MKQQHRKLFISMAILVLCFGISANVVSQGNTELNIVATTTQAFDAATIVGGDHVRVVGLMGAGVDPHLYQPTETDVSAMQLANLVVFNGLFLEGQFDTVFAGLGERNIRVYALSDPVRQAGFIFDSFEGQRGLPDPHFWFDPRNWQLSVEGLAEVLAEMDPAHADDYFANARDYIEQLDLLFDWAFTAMSQIPPEQRTLVTSHDAFEYFGAAFGWSVRGLQGISTEDEAGVADIQELVEFVIENQIPVMYVESSVPPNTIRSVQEAVLAQGGQIEIGFRELFSDAMGEPGTFGGTYIGMLATNIITILQSSGYAVPEWPRGLEPVPPRSLLEAGAGG